MSNFDDPRALERALVTIVQEIIGNAIAPQAVVNTAATAAAATTDVVKGLDLREPWTVLKWLKEARKQIAPHADKVPLPIVQGLAQTIFPPAQAVVPVIRYLQTSPSSKTATSSAAALATLASPGASQQQIYIIPIVQRSPAPHPRIRAVQRTVRDIGLWARGKPILALGLAYALYRARRVPGSVVRVLDRVVNALWAWLWANALRATRRHIMWASKRLRGAKEKAQGYYPWLFQPSPVVAAGEAPADGEGKVRLDIGDAVWVIITAIVAVYVTVNRKKIFKRK